MSLLQVYVILLISANIGTPFPSPYLHPHISSLTISRFYQLDPVARRHLQGLVRRITSGRAVLLTSHDMPEADALASRICIIDHGKSKFLGTSQEAKHKFSSGYTITIKLRREEVAQTSAPPPPTSPNREQSIRDMINSLWSDADLVDSTLGILKFRVPSLGSRPGHVLAKFFEMMETTKDDPTSGVSDYSISQASLEDVFLAVAQS